MSVRVIFVSACPVKFETHFATIIWICPSTLLGVMNWSNHFEFRDSNLALPGTFKIDQA
jgi:hypothetical protein